jgi:hypothetical protein
LEAVVANRNSPQKHVWRAKIVLRDIVGLYVNPPDHAIVLSVDEKSQIQALARTQPSLPMKKGRVSTITHDYKRHGTTTCRRSRHPRRQGHRPVHETPIAIRSSSTSSAKLAIHAIVDNYAAHKHPKVLEWLARHPRFVFHFGPTSASWLGDRSQQMRKFAILLILSVLVCPPLVKAQGRTDSV